MARDSERRNYALRISPTVYIISGTAERRTKKLFPCFPFRVITRHDHRLQKQQQKQWRHTDLTQ